MSSSIFRHKYSTDTSTVEIPIIHSPNNPYFSIIHTFLDLPSRLAGKFIKNPYIFNIP
jgi:hypothetical protein